MKLILINGLILFSISSTSAAQELCRPVAVHYAHYPDILETDRQPWRPIQEASRDTVVQIFTQVAEFNFFQPFETPAQLGRRASGFFINDEGYLLTNAHAVDQALVVWIQIPSLGKKLVDAEIVGVCPDRDIALLRITDEYLPMVRDALGSIPYLTLGDSDRVYRSDEMLALGYPLGQESLKSTTGVISGREETMIQMSAAINPGSSGGPLLDRHGFVVGINSAGIGQAQNVGYIIPINDVRALLPDLFSTPLLRKQMFGVVIVNATDSLTVYLGNPQPGGCYIAELLEGSPLHKAGAQAGDMIYAINGYPIDIYAQMNVTWTEDKISLAQFAARLTRGQSVDFLLYRAGQPVEITALLEDSPILPIRMVYPGFEKIDYEVFGGMVVMELTLNHVELMQSRVPGLAKYAEVHHQKESVLLITHIFPNSLLFKSRILKQGTLINEINSIPVHTLTEFRQALSASFEDNMFRINANDTVMRSCDRIPVVLPFDKLLHEHTLLAHTFHFPISETFKNLYEFAYAA